MLEISSKLMQSFEANALQMFEHEMWEHLQVFAPRLCQTATEKRVRVFIQKGVERAAMYGFTNRGPVRFFLELMFTFGYRFDTDSQHVWAHVFLQGDEKDQYYRAQLLFEAYTDFSDHFMGKNNSILVAALKKIVSLDPDSLILHGKDSHTEISKTLKAIYPERFFTLTPSARHRLIDYAVMTAESRKAQHPSSFLISSSMALLIGWRYDTDPLYFWIGNTLDNSPNKDPDKRYISAFEKSQKYIQGVIQFWEKQANGLNNGFI